MSTTGKKLNPFQHCLLRPDTFIGSIQTVEDEVWVFAVGDESPKIKLIIFNKGLANIIREVFSNVIDNVWRSIESGKPMKNIVINVNVETGEISVWNDGYCIPVHKQEFEYTDHKTGKKTFEQSYPAEVYFGDMLAGTNFDDDEYRKTSGKNGMGAKTTNIFSTIFTVEHTNPEDKKKFTQVYKNNATIRGEPQIEKFTSKVGYTKISFIPDYKRFEFPDAENPGITEDFYSYLRLVAYEMAMLTGVQVTFNEEKIKIPSIEKWGKMIYPNAKTAYFKTEYGDECLVVEKEIDEEALPQDVPLEHMSYVNGIRTRDGGIHVEGWKNAILVPLAKTLNARRGNKNEINSGLLKTYFTFFIRVEADKPAFDTQTKDCLNGIVYDGSAKPTKKYRIYGTGKKNLEDWQNIVDVQVKKMVKWAFVSDIDEKLEWKKGLTLSKKEKVKNNSKPFYGENYDGANKAGPGTEYETTLFITEGLSAKTFAKAGRNSVEGGHDLYGALAIKGKFVNVTNEDLTEIRQKEEVKMLLDVIGLEFGSFDPKTKEYIPKDYMKDENFATLRYKVIVFLTDADDDGEHIKGLLAAFFWKYFPSLYKRGCIKSLSTSVVKLTKGKGKGAQEFLFYTNPQFKRWMDENNNDLRSYSSPEYHKGLGSIPPADIPKYFQDPKVISYVIDPKSEMCMILGFDKEFADCRKIYITKTLTPVVDSLDNGFERFVKKDKKNGMTKERILSMLENYKPNPNPRYEGKMSLSQFVEDNLIIYHQAVLFRAIPCIWDGMKETSRKAFYGLRLKNYQKVEGVEKIAGAIKEVAGYHHGIGSLYDTIIGLAQGFVGKNNIPLFVNHGAFGTRDDGGEKTAAAPRYIATKLEDITMCIFPVADDPILEKRMLDGEEVEFKHFMPIVPMILVNGANGIGCGFSSEIPQHDLLAIIEYVEEWIKSKSLEDLPDLVPSYRGFKGEIELIRKDGRVVGWKSQGILEEEKRGKKSVWHVRELPVGLWTNKFKDHLEALASSGGMDKKGKRDVKALATFDNYSTDNTVHFVLHPTKDFIPDITVKGNMSLLINTNSLNNLTVVDEENFPYRMDTTKQILEIFCQKRYVCYQDRKSYQLKELGIEYEKASNRFKFVKAVVDKELEVNDENVEEIMRDRFQLKEFYSEKKKKVNYDYLLDMPFRSMKPKRLESLRLEKARLQENIKTLKSKTVEMMWLEELDLLKKAYGKFLKTRVEENREKPKKMKKL